MSQLKIRIWPDPDLRIVASLVTNFGHGLQQIVGNMAETMYAHKGAGLAATQVGIHQRIFVMDVSKDQTKLEIFINPQILSKSEERILMKDEGCLSFPGILESIHRHEWVKGTALDSEGTPFAFYYKDFGAQCIQHEIEHLDGKVLVDHFSRPKRRFIEKVLRKRR